MSTFVENFKSQLLPGNYFLTKSMELSRLEDSGTLWYTKKFIVLYYYIFLKNNITNNRTVEEIRTIFDSYIESMPSSMQEKAKGYFYCSMPTADLRSPDFKLFNEFAGTIPYNTSEEEISYKEMAKKYYMAFLMGSGGQSGVNRYIKNKIYDNSFCFSQIDSIINSFKKYTQAQFIRAKNDYMAFVRNERQILFYFGFFHSKSSGAKEREFSSLTPVGKLAIKASYYDLIALWEHQKIKMVSQPVTCDIQKIKGLHVDPSNFFINKSPYLTILKWMQHRSYINLTEYSYLVSRTSHELTPELTDELVCSINDIGQIVEGFNRKSDKKGSADYLKEIKKYLLGIWDLPEDKGDNPFVICEYKSRLNPSEYRVTHPERLSALLSFYSIINEYKLEEYRDVLAAGENELRRQYKTELNATTRNTYSVNPKIKIDWDLFNIHVDTTIMCGILIALIHVYTVVQFKKKNISDYSQKCFDMFSETLRFLGINKANLKKIINKFLVAMEDKKVDVLLTPEKRVTPDIVIREYSADSTAGTWVKIKEESAKETITINGERKRNMTLIALIRTYNNAVNLNEGKLLCECCHQPTFIAQKDNMPYVEYHHLIPFNVCEGPDHYLNLFALCPMCHMKMHHMLIANKYPLYNNLTENNYLHISIEDRLKTLMKKGKITSYHLEYLLADNAITEDQYNLIIA